MEKIEQLRSDLEFVATNHAKACLASSFSPEDMVLIDMIARHHIPVSVFTIDTGRLPEETYSLMQKVRDQYRLDLSVYFPNAESVEAFLEANGPNAFYASVDLRRSCCSIRKVEPLSRALEGKSAWVTGMRRQQSQTRDGIKASEFDLEYGLYKFNPLLEWTEAEIWDYIKLQSVPYNELHDRGYPSIGCAPCTRAITKGEDIRAGRWWWEDASSKECGLHRKKA